MEKRKGSRHAERWYAVRIAGKLESGVYYTAEGTVKAISHMNAEMELLERCKLKYPAIKWTAAPYASTSGTLEQSPILIVAFEGRESFRQQEEH